MTYRELLNEGKKRLAAAGIEEAEVSARELLLFTFGLDFAGLLRRYEDDVPESGENAADGKGHADDVPAGGAEGGRRHAAAHRPVTERAARGRTARKKPFTLVGISA